MSETQSSPRQSARFNASDADVIFQSADNILFNIHRKNLESTTGAFPPSDFATHGQNVILSEPSATLDLMFQYIYPMPQPDVPSLSFEELAPLAEAAEKYQVFPAMLICKIHMQKFLPEHAQEIMAYAGIHCYNDIVEEAAPLLLAIPLEEVLVRLPANFVVPWALYHSTWDKILRRARSFAAGPNIASLRNGENHIEETFAVKDYYDLPNTQSVKCPCHVDEAVCDVLMGLNEVQSLRNIAHVFSSSSGCEQVKQGLNNWRERIEEDVRDIKSFITYL